MVKNAIQKEYTVEDCIRLYERYGYSAIVNDGKLLGFVREPRESSDGRLEIIWLNAAI